MAEDASLAECFARIRQGLNHEGAITVSGRLAH